MNPIDIVVRPLDKPRLWEVVSPASSFGMTIETGFVTDGASIPRPFWQLFPYGGPEFAPAVYHDKMYRTGKGPLGMVITREQADDIFRAMLEINGCPHWKVWAMHKGLRIGGWIVWNRLRSKE